MSGPGIRIAMGLLFLALVACRPPPAPAVVSEPTVEAQIHFASAVEMRRFEGLARHAGTAVPGWRTVPFRRLGNVVEGRWCSPAVPAAVCDGGGVVNDRVPGTAWRQLATLTDDATWPECGGLVWMAGNLPETGWGAVVELKVGGEEAFAASFVSSSPVVRTLRVGDWSVDLGSTTVRLNSPGVIAEARSLVAGPENFSATVRLRYEALIAKVRIAAKEGTIRVWEESAPGGGLPPVRREVTASPSAAAQLAATAEAALTADRDLLVREAGTLHSLLVGLLPPEVLR